MRYLVLFMLFLTAFGCSNGEDKNTNREDTANIGVDSTKVGSDSGILRKLP